MNELYTMPGHLFRRVHQISSALFAEECGETGLTSVQYAALVAIDANPGVDATRLSALVAFDRSTLGDVLERLEAKGWIERGPSPGDRRVKLLRITAEGRRVVHDADAAVRKVQERLLEPLAADDRATLVRLLVQLVERHELAQAPAGAAEPAAA